MPVRVTKSGNKYVVIEASTGKRATNKSGTPVDGEGHTDKAMAEKQAAAINISLKKRGKI